MREGPVVVLLSRHVYCEPDPRLQLSHPVHDLFVHAVPHTVLCEGRLFHVPYRSANVRHVARDQAALDIAYRPVSMPERAVRGAKDRPSPEAGQVSNRNREW